MEPVISVSSLRDQIYNLLKEKIINCEYQSGDKLAEQSIANSLNVSRSPVREAIKQLMGDGLVENIPNKGAFVRKPSVEEMRDMQEMREVFELYAVRRAASTISIDEAQSFLRMRKAMIDAVSRGDVRGYLTLEREFSFALIGLLRNSIMLESYEKIYTCMDNFSFYLFSISDDVEGMLRDSLGDRVAAIDGILSGDSAGAADMISSHLLRSKQNGSKIPNDYHDR